MKKRSFKLSINFLMAGAISILFLASNGCVSVNIGSNAPAAAKNVTYIEPQTPFKELKSEFSDHIWQSTKTGNNISFLSECSSKADPSLEAIQSESLSVLHHPEIIQSETKNYNMRESLQFISKGFLDGVPVQFASVIFKKNNCSYTLTYGGIVKNFQQEKPYFELFMEGFKAP